MVQYIGVDGDKAFFREAGVTRNRSIKVRDGQSVFIFKNRIFKIAPDLKSAVEIVEGSEAPVKPFAPVSKARGLDPIQSEFDINQRFKFLEKFIGMVVDGENASALVTGRGGLGKSHTVKKTIERRNLVLDKDYVIIKGYSTPKALYVTLYENRDKLVVFDDCDSILKDGNALNLLKAALDSYDTRTISWLSKGFIDDGLPNSFDFEGQVIFISNLPAASIDQAIRSRSITVDLSMSMEDVFERIRAILPDILPEYDMDIKSEVLNFIIAHAKEATEINMRTMLQLTKVRFAYGDNPEWEEAARYLLTEGMQ